MRDLEKILNIDTKTSNTSQVVATAKSNLAAVKSNFDEVFKDDADVDPRFNEDFEEIRGSLKGLISEVSDLVSKLSMIAQDSEKAAHFAAMAQLSTTLLNANKQLLEIYSEKRQYHKKDEKKDSEGSMTNLNVNQGIFVGTTADLQKLIQKEIDG